MKPLRRVIFSLAGGLLMVLASIASASGRSDNSCADRDFRGLYAYSLSGTDLRNSTPTAFSASGVFRANGKGNITYWKDAFAIHLPGAVSKIVVPEVDFVAAAQAVGSEIVYSVAPDCRIEIVFTAITPAGPVDFHLRGALANRGREVMLQTGTPYILGTGLAKRTGRRFND